MYSQFMMHGQKNKVST